MNDSQHMATTQTESELLSQLDAEQLLIVAKWLQAEGFAKFEECYSLKFIDALHYAAARLEGLARNSETSKTT